MSRELIPPSWEVCLVEDFAELLRGITYKRHQASKVPQPNRIPILRANNIDQGQLNFDDLVYVDAELVSEEQLVREGDILFAMSSGSKHLVGKSAIAKADFQGSFGAFLGLLRIKAPLDKHFVAYFFQSNEFKKHIQEISKGTNINNLKREHILKSSFPLPPLDEQRRIVAKIEELFSQLDAGVAALEQARAQLKRYRQALLKAAFEGRLTEDWRRAHAGELEPADALLARIRAEREARWRAQLAAWEEAVRAWEAASRPGKKPRKPRKPKELPPLTEEERAELPELPDGWAIEKFGNVCEIVDGDRGKNYPKKHDYLDSGYCVFLNTKNVRPNGFNWQTVQFISKEKHELLGKGTLQEGDIVFTSRGTIGNVALFDKNAPFQVVRINSGMFILRGSETNIHRRYLLYYLQSPHIFYQIEKMRSGTAQPQLPIREFQEFAVIIPGMSEQDAIINKLEEALSTIDHLDQTIEQALARAAALRQAILRRAFAGRLAPPS